MVKESARSLLSLINGILDFTKSETGQMVPQPVRFPLHDSLHEVLGPFLSQARHKGLALHWSMHPEVPDTVVGDLSHLRKVLVHLLENAIKFTAQGEIYVEVNRQPVPINRTMARTVSKTTPCCCILPSPTPALASRQSNSG